MSTSTASLNHATSIKRLSLQAFAWLVIAIVSTGAIIEIFTPEWSRLLVEVSNLGVTTNPATTTSAPAKQQTVVIDSPRLPTTQVATLSASFFGDLITAIMEATSPAQLASAEAKLIQAEDTLATHK